MAGHTEVAFLVRCLVMPYGLKNRFAEFSANHHIAAIRIFADLQFNQGDRANGQRQGQNLRVYRRRTAASLRT